MLLAVLAALVMVVTVAADPKPAEAAFPGRSGKIAFVSGRDGNFEVHGMSAAGGAPTRLTFDPAFDSSPAWQPLP